MKKITFAITISGRVVKDFKAFCKEHGIKYSFFIEEAIRQKLEEEELKEDILDLKTSGKEEKAAVSFEEYLKETRCMETRRANPAYSERQDKTPPRILQIADASAAFSLPRHSKSMLHF